MSKIHIDYTKSNGIEYASVCNSVRTGGKVAKIRIRYLGRVIDKENSIFKNKEFGYYMYDLATDTIKALPPDYPTPIIHRKNEPPRRRVLGLSFGDVFLASEYIKKCGLSSAIDAINYKNMDTLNSLILYYVTQNRSNYHAAEWWDFSYAKLMYPNAQMESQRISEMLADIGTEDAKRNFFKEYYI